MGGSMGYCNMNAMTQWWTIKLDSFSLLLRIMIISKFTAKTAIVAAILDVGFLVAAISVAYFLLQGDMRINVTGFMCSGLNIIMYGSPLAAMRSVVTMKSVDYMPFLLSFFLFLNGGIWTFYACLVHDWFLGVPNAIGFVLGMAQLVLYAIYRNPKATKQLAADLEDGRQREPLLSVPE
ncbi:Nodulin MtN3 family protein [Forsythia ovata]|uniref:Nodulin MtN3 family protein n=1 Tax=Forsythia ovata TaxID=205694 RepID=A0ABD1PXF5_9LAMI